jgi:hypothetical protein
MVVLVYCADDILDMEARMIFPGPGLLDKQRRKEGRIDCTDLKEFRPCK